MVEGEAGSVAKGRAMSRDQWTIIGVGVALLVGLGGLTTYLHSDIRGDIRDLDIRIDNVRSDLSAQIVKVRSDLSAQIGEVRKSIDSVRGDLGGLGERVARVETRLDGVEIRLDGVETRLNGVEVRLARIEGAVGVATQAETAETNSDLAQAR